MTDTGGTPSIRDIVAAMGSGEYDRTVSMARKFSKEADEASKRELLNALTRKYVEMVARSVECGGYSGGLYAYVLAVDLPDSDVLFRNAVRTSFDRALELCSDPGDRSDELADSLFGLALDYMAVPTAAGAVRSLLEKALEAIDSMDPYEPSVEVDWHSAMGLIASGIASRSGACSTKDVSKKSRKLVGKKKEIRRVLEKLSVCVDFGLYESIDVTATMYLDIVVPSNGADRGGKKRSKHRKNRHRSASAPRYRDTPGSLARHRIEGRKPETRTLSGDGIEIIQQRLLSSTSQHPFIPSLLRFTIAGPNNLDASSSARTAVFHNIEGMMSHDVLIPFYNVFTLLRCMLNISNEYGCSPGTKSERRTSSCVKDFRSLEEVTKRPPKARPGPERCSADCRTRQVNDFLNILRPSP